MAKTILGIHGLANKPQREQLERWWKRSLLEGLKHIGSSFADLDFKIVFWADLLYKQQLHNDEHFSFDALYNTEPYLPAKPGELKEVSFDQPGKLMIRCAIHPSMQLTATVEN